MSKIRISDHRGHRQSEISKGGRGRQGTKQDRLSELTEAYLVHSALPSLRLKPILPKP